MSEITVIIQDEERLKAIEQGMRLAPSCAYGSKVTIRAELSALLESKGINPWGPVHSQERLFDMTWEVRGQAIGSDPPPRLPDTDK